MVVQIGLQWTGVCRFRTFPAFSDFKLDHLVVLEGLIRCVDIGAMNEEILAAVIRTNESIPLLRVEEFYLTSSH